MANPVSNVLGPQARGRLTKLLARIEACVVAPDGARVAALELLRWIAYLDANGVKTVGYERGVVELASELAAGGADIETVAATIGVDTFSARRVIRVARQVGTKPCAACGGTGRAP